MSNTVDMQLSLYEANKQLMASEKALDAIMLGRKCEEIANEMEGTEFFMLLNKERSDYTVFHVTDRTVETCRLNEIRETLMNRGKVLSIDRTKDPIKNWEIWIRDIDTDENFCYYLFECNDFIVEV